MWAKLPREGLKSGELHEPGTEPWSLRGQSGGQSEGSGHVGTVSRTRRWSERGPQGARTKTWLSASVRRLNQLSFRPETPSRLGHRHAARVRVVPDGRNTAEPLMSPQDLAATAASW